MINIINMINGMNGHGGVIEKMMIMEEIVDGNVMMNNCNINI